MDGQTQPATETDTDVKMQQEEQEIEVHSITRYEQVDDLFGHIYGIERTLLID
jgi:hypothetical protein